VLRTVAFVCDSPIVAGVWVYSAHAAKGCVSGSSLSTERTGVIRAGAHICLSVGFEANLARDRLVLIAVGHAAPHFRHDALACSSANVGSGDRTARESIDRSIALRKLSRLSCQHYCGRAQQSAECTQPCTKGCCRTGGLLQNGRAARKCTPTRWHHAATNSASAPLSATIQSDSHFRLLALRGLCDFR
jgi:hypothetical protein